MDKEELIIEKKELKKDKWIIKKIKDIAYTRSGGTPRRSEKAYWNGEIPWLKSGELNDNTCITENSEFITKKGLEESSAKLFPKGTLLLAMYGATAGKLGILGMDASTNQAVCSIQNDQGLFNEKYLYNFLLLKREKIIRDSFGGAQPNISKTYIDNIKVPLPSLPAQHRIVSKLDALFAEIDASLALIDQNIAQAEALKLSVLDEEFSIKSNQLKIDKGEWKVERLGAIGQPRMCKRIFKNQTSSEGDIPFYKIGTFGGEPDAFISKELYEEYKNKYSYPIKGQVLISASGTIGRRVVFDGKPSYFQDSNIVWIDNNEEAVLNEYLYHFYGFCEWKTTEGAVIKRLYNKDLKQIEVTYPKAIKLQQKIVQKLDALFGEIDALILDYTKKRDNLEALKSSLLDQAFKGEL